jgi:hypothetical protein
MELYLRAMCEGYVDGETSRDYACRYHTTSLYDYTFENLCYAAFGNRWFTILPLSMRPDNLQGFGPLANTDIMADLYNQFASCLNLLTRVRVMLPMRLEVSSGIASRTSSVTGVKTAADSPAVVGDDAVYWDGTPADCPSPGATGVWAVPDGGNPWASVVAEIDGTGSGSNWNVVTARVNTRIRWQLTEPDAIEALPETWRGMLETHGAVLAKIRTRTVILSRQLTDLDHSQGCCHPYQEPCHGDWYHGDGQYWLFPDVGHEVNTCEIMPSLIEASALGFSTLGYRRDSDFLECKPGPVNAIDVTELLTKDSMIDVPLV